MGEGDHIVNHLNDFNSLGYQLVALGIGMSKEDQCISLLYSLPNPWDNIESTINNSVVDKLKLDEIIEKLFPCKKKQGGLLMGTMKMKYSP